MTKVTQTNDFLVDFFYDFIKEIIEDRHKGEGNDPVINLRLKKNGYEIEADGTCENQHFIITSIGGYNEELDKSFEFAKENLDAMEYDLNSK